MRPGRIVALVIGTLAGIAGLALLAGGAALLALNTLARDADGFYTAGPHRFETATHALTSERIELGVGPGPGWLWPSDVGTVRVVADAPGEAELFIGIARAVDVDAYLVGVAHDEVTDVASDPFDPRYRRSPGGEPALAPTEQDFWVASASGTGELAVNWEVERGAWMLVVMQPDGSAPVLADLEIGLHTDLLRTIGIVLLAVGLAVTAGGIVTVVLAVRGAPGAPPAPVVPPPPAWTPGDPAEVDAPSETAPDRTAAYPVRVEARLDEPLRRWLWLVKWFLALPHFAVLAVLWAAFALLTVAAWFAILVTGRYPRAIFDFNVGVMRWTWRVTYYAFTLGTDRYPPFSLQPDPAYPADLSVEYPERLSRGLIWVKSWLLALPHWIVVAIFTNGAFWIGSGRTDGRVAGIGLIGILVLVAAAGLVVRRRYPRSVYDFVLGMQRWTWRVLAYASLMRDEYPPFRLDPGGGDPASEPAPPPGPAPGPAPDRERELVGTPR